MLTLTYLGLLVQGWPHLAREHRTNTIVRSLISCCLSWFAKAILSAYELYASLKGVKNDIHGDNPCTRFKKTFSRHEDVKIHFLGAWCVCITLLDLIRLISVIRDTVSSVGTSNTKRLPRTVEFNDDICFFRHALALDERRVKFLPEYVCGGESYNPPHKDQDTKHMRVKEVWFAGCHSDMYSRSRALITLLLFLTFLYTAVVVTRATRS